MYSLNFNDAPTQDIKPLPPKVDLDRLRSEVDARAQQILHHLFPAGRLNGSEFEIGNINGDPGDSLRVSLKEGKLGVWADYARDQKGSDIIELWKQSKGLNFKDTITQIQDYLHLNAHTTPTITYTKHAPRELGLPTHKWDYKDAQGTIVATVTRYDPEPGKKEFIPYDCKQKKNKAPDPRPLYNQPGILNEKIVVLVEGEKCADALISLGIPTTTAMGGARAPADKTDWTPLYGKDVLVWPDNDPPDEKGIIAGQVYAKNAAKAITAIGGTARVIPIPTGKPEKWDAADAVKEGFDVRGFLGAAPVTKPRIDFNDWGVDAYRGEPPEMEWLVHSTFPMGSVSILAAMGDAGKGMLGLHLGLQVACEWNGGILDPYPTAFGNRVMQNGSVVILTAEDDRGTVHRRLSNIDELGRRFQTQNKLIVIPLPNAGGPAPIVNPGSNGPTVTPFYKEIREQFLRVPNLKLIIFDPMASFVMADVTKDPAAGSYVTGLLSSLASDTGAAVIVCHHMSKGGKEQVNSPEQARSLVRGTSAIVDGCRAVYCLWPTNRDRSKEVCRNLSIEWTPNGVFMGAVVKANGPADRFEKTFVRQPNGLLMVMDETLSRSRLTTKQLRGMFVEDIKDLAEKGKPFTETGQTGVYERREAFRPELRLSRDRMRRIIRELLDSGAIGKGSSRDSTTLKWLDVPTGAFAKGLGEFEGGFITGDEVIN